MKAILPIILAAFLVSGCTFSLPFFQPQPQYTRASVSQAEIAAQKQAKEFPKLVAFLRANASVANPDQKLKTQLAVYLKNAGLTYQCFDKEGCYFLRGKQRIRVDNKFIFVYGGDNKSFMKIERIDVAVNIIY